MYDREFDNIIRRCSSRGSFGSNSLGNDVQSTQSSSSFRRSIRTDVTPLACLDDIFVVGHAEHAVIRSHVFSAAVRAPNLWY